MKSKTKKTWASCILLALVVSLLGFQTPSESATSGGIVTYVQGKASFNRSGAKGAVYTRQIISAGTHLYTGSNSRLEVLFRDGTRLRLGPASHYFLAYYNKARNSAVAQSNQGRFWSHNKSKANKKYIMKSKHAMATVMGTTYTFDVNEERTESIVFQGEIAVGLPQAGEDEKILDKVPTPMSTPEPDENTPFTPPTEIKSPVHQIPSPVSVVPGPYEVSLDQWLQIVENQKIEMGIGGQAKISEIDPQKTIQADEWYQWNKSEDKKEFDYKKWLVQIP